MSIKNKLVAGISALMISLSLTACADTSWTSKIEGEEIKAGVYILYTIQGYNDAYAKLSVNGEVNEDKIFSQKIDDQDVSSYIQDYATNMCKRMVAINKKFDELGLSLSETDKKAIKLSLDNEWKEYEDDYTKEGVSKKSVEAIIETNYKTEMIFKKYYGENGIQEVSQDTINEEMNKQIARVMLLPLSITDTSTNKPLDEAGINEVIKNAEGYIERVNNGESFSDIIDEHHAEKYPDAESSQEAEEAENPDPYKNENIIYEGKQYLDPTVITQMLEMEEYNELTIVKGTSYYYIVNKLDLFERKDVVEQNKESILVSLKNDDYIKMLEGWYADYTVEKNDDAYERYTPKKVMEKTK